VGSYYLETTSLGGTEGVGTVGRSVACWCPTVLRCLRRIALLLGVALRWVAALRGVAVVLRVLVVWVGHGVLRVGLSVEVEDSEAAYAIITAIDLKKVLEWKVEGWQRLLRHTLIAPDRPRLYVR